MGSFLQRKLNEQSAREAARSPEIPADPFYGIEPSLAVMEPKPAPPAPAPAAPAVKPIGVENRAKPTPSPRVAALRRQIRTKLLASPDEADGWARGDIDKEILLTGRLETVIEKMGRQIPKQDYEELKKRTPRRFCSALGPSSR